MMMHPEDQESRPVFSGRSMLPRQAPFYGGRFQNGITDPLWPVETPEEVAREDEAKYDDYRGRIDPQKFVMMVRADVLAKDRDELRHLLESLTDFAHGAMEKKPSRSHLRALAYSEVPATWRVTVTVGLGATLFLDSTGFDRYGIRSARPRHLKVCPGFPGDAPDFHPAERASDLIVAVASDHPYVNVAIVRDLAERFSGRFRRQHGGSGPILEVRSIEQGFGRPDKREFLRFDDGIENLRAHPIGPLERLVYVGAEDPEPAWCRDGSYLVYRKIREHMPVWEAFAETKQEGMIGRKKRTGRPLSRKVAGDDELTPVYPDPTDPADGPLSAHIRKVQPRRPGTDLFGLDDVERRFLRRPYPFVEGLDGEGGFTNGLLFLAFMKSIQRQFEHVTNMWQMNPDFPVPGTGIDALFARGVLSTVDGGYYFCPPAPTDEKDFLGSGIFE